MTIEGRRYGNEAFQMGARRSGEGAGCHRPEISGVHEPGCERGARLRCYRRSWAPRRATRGVPRSLARRLSVLDGRVGLAATAVGGRQILFRDNALVVPSEDSERIAHAIQRAGVYVALGCNEMDPRPEVQTIYNSLIFFAPAGTVLGRHRNLMPTFTERLFWGQGDARDLTVFDTDIGRLSGLICGEHVMTDAGASVHDRAGRGHPRRSVPWRIRTAYGAAARRNRSKPAASGVTSRCVRTLCRYKHTPTRAQGTCRTWSPEHARSHHYSYL